MLARREPVHGLDRVTACRPNQVNFNPAISDHASGVDMSVGVQIVRKSADPTG